MTTLMSGDYMGWHHDMGAGSWVLMVLFWGLVVAGLVWLVVSTASRRPGRSDALEILDRRLAEGEISVEEFRERHQAIATSASRPEAPTSV